MRTKVTDYFLYRWRFIAGYAIVGAAFIGLLIVAGLYIPGGISQGEMSSVVASSKFSVTHFDPSLIINLPYHLLQQASLHIFGISAFSIKLPSLVLGAAAGVGMLLLLQMWFRRSVAVLTSLLVITTGQFLFIAQNGTPSIVYIFWSVWLLVAAMMISRGAKCAGLWKVILLSVAALSLYTPLSIYILIALGSATVLHPHLRYLMRRVLRARVKISFALLCALILIAPLVYAVVLHPGAGLTLLGIPTTKIDTLANVLQLGRQYFDFISPTSETLMTPIYSLGPMILIVLGILHLITTKYTARSYIISIWAILLLPALVINPNMTAASFVPAMLLLAMGIHTLLRNWYRLFPKNPYARLAGLIPLIVLISGMVISGVDRYMYGYLYDPGVADHFSSDISLINPQLSHAATPVTIVVSQAQLPFYTVVAAHHTGVQAVTSLATPVEGMAIVSHDAHATASPGVPWRILTDPTRAGADRFYIYKPSDK